MFLRNALTHSLSPHHEQGNTLVEIINKSYHYLRIARSVQLGTRALFYQIGQILLNQRLKPKLYQALLNLE